MLFLLLIQFILLFNSIKGNDNNFGPLPRQQETGQPLVLPKTIIISGKKGQINTEDPNVLQTVMNVVNNQMKSDANNRKDGNGNDVPEVIYTSGESEQFLIPNGPPVERVYRLPTMTRLIATEEESDNKKTPFWRSPTPVFPPMHEGCPHHKHHKKSKTIRKKSRKTPKTESVPQNGFKPKVDESVDPFESILGSILSNALQSSPEPQRQVNEVKPMPPFFMSISQRVHPFSPIDLPKPKPHGIIAIIRKRHEPMPLPQPELGPMNDGLQLMQSFGLPVPPINPFLSLLSKLEEQPVDQKDNFNKGFKGEYMSDKGMGDHYNFNVNLTINNYNYPQMGRQRDVNVLPFPFNLK